MDKARTAGEPQRGKDDALPASEVGTDLIPEDQDASTGFAESEADTGFNDGSGEPPVQSWPGKTPLPPG